jgi:hypothetical protein
MSGLYLRLRLSQTHLRRPASRRRPGAPARSAVANPTPSSVAPVGGINFCGASWASCV